ncbi:MAG: hypothetical protein KF799_06035 [Bdellovibrionales bacterium]|nr:hypothetical protein [Bdellovibrionales bacterium]
MKALFALIALSSISLPAFATVDAMTNVYIVTQNVQDPDDFSVERGPVIGCYGLARGPQLAQFTAEYKVTSNIGCGGPVMQENINYLTCAKVTDAIESDDYMGFKEITLDISKCDAKNNKKLITMIRTAAKRNFPLNKGEVKLNLIK